MTAVMFTGGTILNRFLLFILFFQNKHLEKNIQSNDSQLTVGVSDDKHLGILQWSLRVIK